MSRRAELASLSLDLDNQWSYMKTHGDAGWEEFPSYLDLVVPRVLDLLDRHGLTITVFVVGQDAALDRNREPLAALAAAGHEIGNHSFRHEPWLHLYDEHELEVELARAEDAIEAATGMHPVGFRGPGYSVSEAVARVLARRGYLYDASTLPTFIGPLARLYYFRTARLGDEQRRERARLFGSFRDARLPLRPYRWQLPEASLLELPVTTMPLLRVPIHFSYVLFLHQRSPGLARRYFAAALALCRRTGVEPSLLLHPLDFMGPEDAAGLSFFPAMGLAAEAKIDAVGQCLDQLAHRFEVVTVERHARALLDDPNLREKAPL